MNLRFLLNYPENQSISNHLIDFFWAELAYSRANRDHELYLVSPWITESNFDLSERKVFEDLWPGFSKTSIPLSLILKKFLDYDSKIHITCRPPHMLVSIGGYVNYDNTKQKINKINDLFTKLSELEEEISELASKQKLLKADIKSKTKDLDDSVSELKFILDIFHSQAKNQHAVLSFIQDLKEYGGQFVEVSYNYRLHAKILVGKFGGFFGSANITHSGFNYNDELFAYLTEENAVSELRGIAKNLGNESQWWRKTAERYSPWYEFSRQVGKDTLSEVLKSTNLSNDLKEILQLIGFRV